MADADAMESIETCPVCWDGAADVPLMPCGHALCATCVPRVLNAHITCPICRSGVCGVRDDRAPDVGPAPDDRTVSLTVTFPDRSFPGVTATTRRLGLLPPSLTRVNPAERCFQCGLRLGDEVLCANGIECFSDRLLVSILDTAACKSMPVRLHVRRRAPASRWKKFRGSTLRDSIRALAVLVPRTA